MTFTPCPINTYFYLSKMWITLLRAFQYIFPYFFLPNNERRSDLHSSPSVLGVFRVLLMHGWAAPSTPSPPLHPTFRSTVHPLSLECHFIDKSSLESNLAWVTVHQTIASRRLHKGQLVHNTGPFQRSWHGGKWLHPRLSISIWSLLHDLA